MASTSGAARPVVIPDTRSDAAHAALLPFCESEGIRSLGIVIERARHEQTLMRERAMFATGPVVTIRWGQGAGWPVLAVSPNVTRFGYSPEDQIGGRVLFSSIVHPEDLARVQREVQDAVSAGAKSVEQHYRIRGASGRWRNLYDHTSITLDARGGLLYTDGCVVDVTEQRKLEQELLQAQKMESVGRLAGGLAHRAVARIRAQAGDRPRIVDVDALLHETADLLRRVIGSHIQLVIERPEASSRVRIDSGQLQQILVNLALNARDAMPRGGTLTIGTGVPEIASGAQVPMVEIRVADTGTGTGTGMSPETIEHLF